MPTALASASELELGKKGQVNMKLCGLLLLIGCSCLVAQDKVSWFDEPVGMKSVIVANGAMWAGAAVDAGSSCGQIEGNGLLAGRDGKFGAKGLGIKIGINGGVTVVTVVVAKKWPRSRRAMVVVNGIVGGAQMGAGISNLVR